MSISSINQVGRVTSSTSQRPPMESADPSTSTPQDSENIPDQTAAASPPPPPRFPWLSRMTQELEAAAKQKPAFPSAPVLGDNVDQSA